MTNSNWTEPSNSSRTPADTPSAVPPTYPSTPGPNGLPAASFFDSIRRLQIVRPQQGRRAAGVCAGVARRLGIEPLAVRVITVLAALAGVGIFLYGLGWLFLPQEDGRIHAQQLLAGRVTAGAVGAVIVSLSGIGDVPMLPLAPFHRGAPVGGVLVVVAVVLLVVHRRNRRRRLGL